MERYETQKIEVNGKKVSFYSWRFTSLELDHLKLVLAKFPIENVTQFVNDLEDICRCAKQYLYERNITFQRSEKKRMLGRFEKTEKELNRLLDAQTKDAKFNIPLKEKRDIFDCNIVMPDYEEVGETERLYHLILGASLQLKCIIEIIKKELTRKPGRPSVDVATGELVKIIASCYKNYFEKPKKNESKSIDNNPFFPIVQIALNACGLPLEFPDRHIRAALKTL
jgi:hypothetical protein